MQPSKLLVLPLSLAVGVAAASPPQNLRPNSPDLQDRSHTWRSHLPVQATAHAPAVSNADVGDADSFGRKVVYAGVLGSYDVYLQEDCSGFPAGNPGSQCVALNPQPASTSFNLTDMGHITLPGDSTHSLLCFHTTTFQEWNFLNETASPAESQIRFQEGVTIENPLLNDPSLIDPTTGLPFNGKLTVGIGTFIGDGGTLDPGHDRDHHSWSTRTCQGGAISTDSLETLYNLPQSVVKNFFKQQMTIRLNVEGNATLAQEASLTVGIRFYGD